jgi:IKAROS family zinc finger protein
MKRHSNEKKFKCNTCSKAFYEKQDLERHVILHSGEKPHKCPYCTYACAFKGNLTKHLNKRHAGLLLISESKNKVKLATD